MMVKQNPVWGVDRLPAWRLWIFSAPSFPINAITIAVAMYLPQHFARNLGLDLAAVGAAFALVRLIDLPVDPLLGVAMDRSRTAFGRYRPWALLGAPVVMLAIYMLFMAQPGITTTYVMVWLLVLYLGTSIVTLAHTAWASNLAPTYNERSRVFGALGATGVAGMTLLLAVPLISSQLGFSEKGLAVGEMGWFILAATPVALIAATMSAGERIVPHVPGESVALRDYLALLRNGNMVRVSIASLLFTLGTSWEGGLFMFYATDVRGLSVGQASLILMCSLAAGLAGAPMIGRVARRFNKHGTLVAISIAYGVTLFSLWLIPADAPVAVLYIPYVFTGFLYAGFLVLLRAMTADIADEIHLEQGKERSALLYAVITLAPKVSGALAIWLTFTALAQTGYDASANAINTDAAISGLSIAYILGPNGFIILGAVSMIGYTLNRRRAAEIRDALDARAAREVVLEPSPS